MIKAATSIARFTGLRFRFRSGIKQSTPAPVSTDDAKYARHCATVRPHIRRRGWIVGSPEHRAWWDEQERAGFVTAVDTAMRKAYNESIYQAGYHWLSEAITGECSTLEDVKALLTDANFHSAVKEL